MNDIIHSGSGGETPATMSSKEIAALCEKRHGDVLRDIRTILEALGDDADLRHLVEDKDSRGYTKEFHLPKDLTLTLVAGYNIQLRHRIVKRLEELEQRSAPNPAILSRMQLIQIAYDAEKEAQQERAARIEVESKLDRIATADGSLCVTDAAKALQVRPKDLFSKLQADHWIYRRTGGKGYLGYQAKVQSGLVEHKVDTVVRPDGSEAIREQVRITPKGLARLAGEVGNAA
jgi:phage antirepressor YoqD-like protein